MECLGAPPRHVDTLDVVDGEPSGRRQHPVRLLVAPEPQQDEPEQHPGLPRRLGRPRRPAELGRGIPRHGSDRLHGGLDQARRIARDASLHPPTRDTKEVTASAGTRLLDRIGQQRQNGPAPSRRHLGPERLAVERMGKPDLRTLPSVRTSSNPRSSSRSRAVVLGGARARSDRSVHPAPRAPAHGARRPGGSRCAVRRAR